MSKQLRVLVCGDVKGDIDSLFRKVDGIIEKAGSFDALICTGDFFGNKFDSWLDFVSQKKEAPLQTFILGPVTAEQVKMYPELAGYDMAKNITYLGKRGVYRCTSGLSIAYLSGIDGTDAADEDPWKFHNRDSDFLINKVNTFKDFKGVDILISSLWPRGVDKYARTVPDMDSDKVGSVTVSQVATLLKPRYHFCSYEEVYYERSPYRNHKILQGAAEHVTRFVALASLGNKKRKHLYAFNLVPMKHMDQTELIKVPEDATESPYKMIPLLEIKEPENPQPQFFFSTVEKPVGGKRRMPMPNKPDGKRPIIRGPCWFCLGTPDVEKHLVCCIGAQVYLAMAKGSLTTDHILISSIAHYQSTVTCPEIVVQEIEGYKNAIRRYLEGKGKIAIFFERNFHTSHLQVQMIPVDKLYEKFLHKAIQDSCEKHHLNLDEIPEKTDLKEIIPESVPYFYMELHNGERYLHRIHKHFPLQFGREIAAHPLILNIPDKIDWKRCQFTKEKEETMAKSFREGFKRFDILKPAS